ncbi:MAG: hypothetical protein QM479_14680 [Pseudomonadota bacterium]
MFKRICIFLFLGQLLLPSWVIASYEYAVIATHKKATTIKQQLSPLFKGQASFSAKGYQLIIKASPSVINEIRHLLKQIDSPLQNLLIQVANQKTIDQQLKKNSGSYKSHKQQRGSVKITSTENISNRKNHGIYQARSVEGNWVTIYTGKEVPYYISNYYQTPQTQFKKITSGFEAKAELKNKNQVVIYIRAQNSQQNKNYAEVINSSSIETTISGNLNQWISIGQIAQDNKQNQQQYGVQYGSKKAGTAIQYNNRSQASQENYYIKVTTTQ